MGGRPRTPRDKADITGQSTKNPKRYKSRSKGARQADLGPAFPWMGEEREKAFEQIRRSIPWLKESDRTLAEVAAVLYARLMADPEEMPVAAMNQLRMCLSSMGATPADISKVSHGDDESGDPTDRFFDS